MKSRRQVRAPSVLLDAGTADGEAKWLECAYEGAFKGHWMGEFEFTAKTFDQIVKNFHAHPAYKSGAEQADAAALASGAYDVVQWDMHHASEQPPTAGEIPVVGAPAQGWVCDVKTGLREDGKACLYALTRWLEPARTYVKERRYKWCSVAVVFNAVDPVTSAPIGAQLTSIAITNQPFLQDLPALAASLYRDQWATATGPVSVINQLREKFDLEPTATDEEVAAKVAELKTWCAPGATVPAGVDVEYALQCLRGLLNLPTLTTSDVIFFQLESLFTTPAPAGAKEQTMTTAAQPAATVSPASPAEDLHKSIVTTLARLRNVAPDTITNTGILLAVEQGAAASSDLAALLQGLDVKNLAAGLAQIDALKKIKLELDKLLPQYEAATAQIDQMDQAAGVDDVGMAMASFGFDPKDPTKAALVASLTRDRKADKAKFRADYKLDAVRASMSQRTEVTLDITQPLTTQRTVPSAFDGLRLGAGGQFVREPLVTDKPSAKGEKVDLSTFPGANPLQQAINFVRSQKGGDKLTLEDAHIKASLILASA